MLGIYLREMKNYGHIKIDMWMFLSASVIIAKNGNTTQMTFNWWMETPFSALEPWAGEHGVELDSLLFWG